MEAVLESVGISSTLHVDTCIILIDPIKGIKITVREQGEKWKIRLHPASDEIKQYPYTPEELKSSKRSEKTILKTEKKPENLFETELKREKPILNWRIVKPAEPCEKCKTAPVEYEITDIDDLVVRRCPPCFQDMKRVFSGVEWRKSHD